MRTFFGIAFNMVIARAVTPNESNERPTHTYEDTGDQQPRYLNDCATQDSSRQCIHQGVPHSRPADITTTANDHTQRRRISILPKITKVWVVVHKSATIVVLCSGLIRN